MQKEIDKLAWIYIQDGKLLGARSKDKSLFYLPGGKREAGESDEQALVREIKEEISVDLVPNSIQYAATFEAQADGKANDTVVRLTCYFADFKGELNSDAEIEEIAFFTSNDKTLWSEASIKAIDWLKQQALIQ